MNTRFLIGLNFAVGLSGNLSLRLTELLPFFSTGLQPVFAQGSGEKRFWVWRWAHPSHLVGLRPGRNDRRTQLRLGRLSGQHHNIKGIEHAGEYQHIAQALLKREYSDGDTAKIKRGKPAEYY